MSNIEKSQTKRMNFLAGFGLGSKKITDYLDSIVSIGRSLVKFYKIKSAPINLSWPFTAKQYSIRKMPNKGIILSNSSNTISSAGSVQ